MRVRLDVMLFAILLVPLVLAGILTVHFAGNPPSTRYQYLALALFVGVPLYFACIILHYTVTKARRTRGGEYSHAFLSALVAAGYLLGLIFGYIILKG